MAKHIVVIGAGVGGLSAAIHARLKGHSVLLLEASEKCGGKAAGIESSGYLFDPGPSIIILTRLYEQLFKAAGRKMANYLQFQRLDPITRVYFEGESFDLPQDLEGCRHVIREHAPEDLDAFDKFMGQMAKVSRHVDQSVFRRPYLKPTQLLDPHLLMSGAGFNPALSYKQIVDNRFKSRLLRAFFYGFPSYGGQTYDSKAIGAFMIPYLMIAEGVYYPMGGVAAIPKAMERLARELDVEIRTGARVTGLETQGDKIQAVQLENSETIQADAFISNVDVLTTQQLLGSQTSAGTNLSYFTVQWGLSYELNELQHHNLLIPQDFERGFEELYREKVFPTNPIIYLNKTPETPEGCSNLFAVVTSPGMEEHIDWEMQEQVYKERVIDAIRSYGIDLDMGRAEVERVQTPLYFQREHGNYRGSLYGPSEDHRLFGMFPLSNKDPKYKNLLYCGGSTQPGAGLPMVTLSGKFAADLISAS